MGAHPMVSMNPQWLRLRWPLTVLALGGMATALLMRSSQHPIQLRLVVSFSEPLNLSGKVQSELNMPKPIQVTAPNSVRVQVTEQVPIDLSVRNTTPVQVQVSNPEPINTLRELWGKACTQPNAKK